MKLNKFNLGDLVYFVALDENLRWTVYGSIICGLERKLGEWQYTVKGHLVNYTRPEQNIYLNQADAQKAADNLNKKAGEKPKTELPK